eukprot:m.110611 g.110611  ORF g.110611 m.110611 type:complete len:267 (-) comp28055_c0_seq2:364-1164(-)
MPGQSRDAECDSGAVKMFFGIVAIASFVFFILLIVGGVYIGTFDQYDEDGPDWLDGECQVQSVTSFEGWCTYDYSNSDGGAYGPVGKSEIEYFVVNMDVLLSSSDTRLFNDTFSGFYGIANLFVGHTPDCSQTDNQVADDPAEECEGGGRRSECFYKRGDAESFANNYLVAETYPCFFDPKNHSNIAFVTTKTVNEFWTRGLVLLSTVAVFVGLVTVCCVFLCCHQSSSCNCTKKHSSTNAHRHTGDLEDTSRRKDLPESMRVSYI